MAKVSEVLRGWLGWCPNTPGIHTVPIISPTPHVTTWTAEPQDPSGRPGRIRTGAGIAADSIRTLLREKSLLWFSACAGLVIAFMFLSLYTVHVFAIYPYEIISAPVGTILTFCIEFMSASALCYLFAGLVSSTSEEHPGRQAVRNGMSAARNSLRSILIWSAILSIVVTATYTTLTYYFIGVMSGIYSLLTQFPFYFISTPEIYGTGPIAGGFHMIAALSSTLTLMALNVIFIILTLFVIPSIVLGGKTLESAVKDSVVRIKRVWREALTCILVFFLILLAVSATALLFPWIYEITTLRNQLTWYPGDGWVVTAFLYMAAWSILVVLGLTAAGIAVKKLYDAGKTNPL